MKNVQICGLMMMASHVSDEDVIRKEFCLAADFFDEMKTRYSLTTTASASVRGHEP